MPYFLLQKLMESAAPKMQPATELSQGKQPLGNRMIVMVIRCIRSLSFSISHALSSWTSNCTSRLTDNVSRIRESVHAYRAGWLDGRSYLLCNACIGSGASGAPASPSRPRSRRHVQRCQPSRPWTS